MPRNGRQQAWMAVLTALVLGSGCSSRDAMVSDSFAEPDVFEIMRAGNARAVLDSMTARYEDELQHVRILREDISELLAAEEGLARRLQSERETFEDLQAEVAEARSRNEREQARLQEMSQATETSTQQIAESEAALKALREEIQALQAQAATLEEERGKVEADLARARDIVAGSQLPDTLLIAELRALLAKLDEEPPPEDPEH